MADHLDISTESVTTRTCVIWKERVLHVTVLDGAQIGLADAHENVRTARSLAGDRRYPMLVDLRRLRSQSAEARAYFAGPEGSKVCSRTAMLIASPLSRAIGNFYLGFNRPLVPTQLFTEETAAMAWLLSVGEAAA